MKLRLVWIAIVLIITVASEDCWHGVNLSGLEFGSAIPGQYGKDYIAPNSQEVDYFVGKGMNIFRLPFRWERLQGQANGQFNSTYLNYIQTFVSYATSKGARVILDPHNYARYYNKVIGSNDLSVTVFQDLWTKLATAFQSNPLVIFGLMNEPNGMTTELWLSDANAAIKAIRATGSNHTIFVPGNAWSGAWSWNDNWYGTPNGEVMKGVADPRNNFIFEVHQYLDADSSGTNENCVSSTIGTQRVQAFTAWCKQNGFRAFLGEWAGGRNAQCYAAISDLLNTLNANRDVYVGWTWWGGGPWWGDYLFALDPTNGQDRPQMQYLLPHLRPDTC